jgi:hypothetical protein
LPRIADPFTPKDRPATAGDGTEWNCSVASRCLVWTARSVLFCSVVWWERVFTQVLDLGDYDRVQSIHMWARPYSHDCNINEYLFCDLIWAMRASKNFF